MILKFKDSTGKEHSCVSELNVKGKIYYITFDNDVYIKDKTGIFVQCTEIPEEIKICLKEPESLDLTPLAEDTER